MIADTLPDCLCGGRNYEGGGGYVGGGLAYTCWTCGDCKRRVMELHPWLFYNTDANPTDEREIERYVNATIMPFRNHLQEHKQTANIPPKVPVGLMVFYRDGDDWVPVDRTESATVPVPIDPLALKHREFWAALVDDVGAKEIPNEYYNDASNLEPWYEFKVVDATIKFGPRKRVLTLKVEREVPFEVGHIAKLAKTDETSFWADGSWHQWDAPQAKTLEVHAWGKEKFDQYLAAIMYDLGRSHGDELNETASSSPP